MKKAEASCTRRLPGLLTWYMGTYTLMCTEFCAILCREYCTVAIPILPSNLYLAYRPIAIGTSFPHSNAGTSQPLASLSAHMHLGIPAACPVLYNVTVSPNLQGAPSSQGMHSLCTGKKSCV